ncbi:hypothetical protein HAX54_024617 [Datura stramonium]|uniref:Uncharacterized protein n=1 Tax=Datura stramonium TaxID=4076 RepID=A0ABS8RGA6_DATST|nr:hypothetical protein [Datura stramonium]
MGSSASTAKEQLVVNSEENIKKVTVVAGVAIVGLLLLKLLDNNNNCVNRKVMKAPAEVTVTSTEMILSGTLPIIFADKLGGCKESRYDDDDFSSQEKKVICR